MFTPEQMAQGGRDTLARLVVENELYKETVQQLALALNIANERIRELEAPPQPPAQD